jgi:hypothetical protein
MSVNFHDRSALNLLADTGARLQITKNLGNAVPIVMLKSSNSFNTEQINKILESITLTSNPDLTTLKNAKSVMPYIETTGANRALCDKVTALLTDRIAQKDPLAAVAPQPHLDIDIVREFNPVYGMVWAPGLPNAIEETPIGHTDSAIDSPMQAGSVLLPIDIDF